MQRSFILSPLVQRLTFASAFALLLALMLILAAPVQAQDDPQPSPPGETVSLVDEIPQEAEQEHAEEPHKEPVPPIWLILPFITLLLMIATGPLFYAHHWHHHYPKYAVGLGDRLGGGTSCETSFWLQATGPRPACGRVDSFPAAP